MAFLLDHVNAETFETQRRVVENELLERFENAPYGRVGSFIRERLFPAPHPYRGRMESGRGLEHASLEEVRRFWRAYYRPNNATLFLSGDIRVEDAKAQIEKYFGPIVPGVVASPPLVDHLADPPEGSRIDIEAGVPAGMVIMTWLTPPFGAKGDAELDVIADMLEHGGMTWDLLEDLQIASHVGVGQYSRKLASTFQISITARNDVSPERIVEVVDKAIDRFRHRWQQPSFIRSMSFRTVLELALSYEHPTRRVAQMAEDAFITGDPNFVERNVARYEAVTPQTIMETADLFLSPRRRLLTVVTPQSDAPIAGRLTRSK